MDCLAWPVPEPCLVSGRVCLVSGRVKLTHTFLVGMLAQVFCLGQVFKVLGRIFQIGSFLDQNHGLCLAHELL